MKNGLFEENGELIYYKDDLPCHMGVIKENDAIYYIGKNGRAVKGTHTVHTNMANGIIEHGTYIFGNDYKLIKPDENKNGLFEEDGNLVYYRNGRLCHAGVIKVGKDIYYISSNGLAVKGRINVHHEMTNGILKRGTYTFGDDYKLVSGSFIPRKKSRKKSKKHKLSFKSRMAILIVGLVLFAVLLVLASHFGSKNDFEDTSEDPTQKETEMPFFEKKILLCSDAAKNAYDGKITVGQAVSSGNPYLPFVFKYSLAGTDGTLLISEYPDMRNADEYILSSNETSVTIDNLKTGTKYYYKASVGGETFPGYFETSDSPRFVNIPGVKNTRDIGGYTTLDGKKVRQGLLIRGSEIDGYSSSECFLEKNSVQYVKDTFGFVCEIDLRSPDIFKENYQTRLGTDVEHKHYDSSLFSKFLSEEYRTAVRLVFEDLANSENYPMYIHCTNGADATGMICFLLEAVLNLPEETMEFDFRLSGFYKKDYASTKEFNTLYGIVEGYDGDTVQEKIVSYLTSPEIGVTEEEIEAIRNIFLAN